MSLWQQIDLVRQTISTAPKLLHDLTVQSTNLQNILRDIQSSTELHTRAMHNQIEYICSITLELQKILMDMATLNRQSLLRQSLHALRRRTRDESRLNNVLLRLEKAKVELLIRMSIIHIEKSGGISEGIQRIDLGARKESFESSSIMTVDLNYTEREAAQVNGIAGLEDVKMRITASVTENAALDNSRQSNLILCGPGSMQLLQSIFLEA
ncbi:hypothetical protein SCUP234_06777 [Seiridium cupressi]